MTPYYKDGERFSRVTEVTGAIDCEATAAIEQDPKKRKNSRTSHSVTLPGTLTHSKIQQFEERSMGKTISGLYMQGTDKQLFTKIYAQHRKMKKKDAKVKTTYMDMMEKVNDCFANYLAYNVDHPHKSLLIEHRMLSTKYRCGGTVDQVGLYWVKGHSIRATPDPKGLPKKVYFKICDHGANCNTCHKEEVLVVADWKTSTRKQDGHRLQMSAYFCMLEEEGIFDEWRKRGVHICWETWSILLGVHSKKKGPPYQLIHYDPTITDFLVSRGVNENPEYITRNLKGKTGLKGRCMFCSYLLSCPDRLLWSLDGDMEFQTTFTRKELAFMNMSLMNKKSKDMAPVMEKITRYLAFARTQEDEINTLMPEVLKEFETKLDIQVATEAV